MKQTSKLSIAFVFGGLFLAVVACAHSAQKVDHSQLVVRIAELAIEPTLLDAYRAALIEEIEASVRLEPGVLSLNSVALNDNPAHIRLLEVYASQAAYEAHLISPHFQKYKVTTEKMVKSLNLIVTTPVRLCSKEGLSPNGTAFCI